MGVRSSQEQHLEMCILVQPAQMWPPGPLMCPHHKIQHQKGFVSGHVWISSCPPGEALRHHFSSVNNTVVKNLPGRRRGRSRVATNEPPHVVPTLTLTLSWSYPNSFVLHQKCPAHAAVSWQTSQSSAGTRDLSQWREGCAQWSWVPRGNMLLGVGTMLQGPVLVGTWWPWHHHKQQVPISSQPTLSLFWCWGDKTYPYGFSITFKLMAAFTPFTSWHCH